ncbi:MAG: hypothetical protein IKT03_04405 [Muribaculaceae bacterium]|nr:hypothetical protein [Muribaculaceae bacterium]
MLRKHIVQSWLLLIIIVSMQLVSSFHIHESHPVIENVKCEMCSHHVHHSGHFTSDQYHMHPCLSCQISSNEYIAPQVTHLASVFQHVVIIDSRFFSVLPICTFNRWLSRAPPVI